MLVIGYPFERSGRLTGDRVALVLHANGAFYAHQLRVIGRTWTSLCKVSALWPIVDLRGRDEYTLSPHDSLRVIRAQHLQSSETLPSHHFLSYTIGVFRDT